MKQNNNLNFDVRVNTIENGGNVKAYASVNIGGAYAIKNLRIIEGSKGIFVAMPSVKNHKGEYDDIFFPITKESRTALNDSVIAAYEKKLEMSDNHTQEQKDAPELSM
ncbi:SpoVG family protein [Niameybacter massiliensis]|uniref:SpoVG family protein n=1 Tax=Holtiella tumoricola TaxID=3018743 RepID=A0AA42DLY0_9FIRM|nr:SpoVG family protein [Holtiella tumoricola]MDA3731406.1 SpoVG family protein [Holtiella tumoricola]